MTSDTLLRLARALLSGHALLADPIAVRAAVLLARRALELDVAERLARALPGAERGTFRAQLLCLRSLDEVVGADAAQLHGELSHACHQHPYELSPTVDEGRGLVERTAGITPSLTGAVAT